MDIQTDSYGETSIPPQLRWRGVNKLIFNVEKSLKNDPLEVKISLGESLFHDMWFKI